MSRLCSLLQTLAIGVVLFGCDANYELDGSFEESKFSGRHIDGDATEDIIFESGNIERYYRFHFRQFGDDLGGTFETFDMSSRDLFTQVPTFMENAVNLYYCARIDYGYVRGHTAYVYFTDREQRQWGLVLDLRDGRPQGTLKRAHFSSIADIMLEKADYYLPEDVEYDQKVREQKMPYAQIALDSMKDSKRSLSCIYYYKTRRLDVSLPSALMSLLSQCTPSQSRCDDYKLAVIGMPPQHRLVTSGDIQPWVILSARLDDCDITNDRKRTILLRENPNTILGSGSSGLFIATLIAYFDVNHDDHWDVDSEPILAALDGQTLVFYDKQPGTQYGNSFDGKTYEVPVIREEQFSPSTGWYLYNDDAVDTQDAYRALQKLTNDGGSVPMLRMLDKGGCYLAPNEEDKRQCLGIIPVLMQ